MLKRQPFPVKLPAYAYLDGGTAAMIVQVLLASLLGVMVFWRNLWSRLKTFLHIAKKEEPPADPKEPSDNE